MLENNKCLVEIRVDEIQKLLAAKQVLDELHDKEIEVEQLKAENKELKDNKITNKNKINFQEKINALEIANKDKKEIISELNNEIQRLNNENQNLHYLSISYHVYYEGALGAMEAAEKESDYKKLPHWIKVAKNYLSFRYKEEQAKKIYDKHFSELKAENIEKEKTIQIFIQERNKLQSELKNLLTKSIKYESSLKEIKEMCKYDCENECSNNKEKCGICTCLEQRIQRKISEVIK